MRRFLYDAEAGTRALLSFVKEQALDHYERISETAEKKLDVYCSDSGGSYGLYDQRKNQLQLSYGFLHELGHILVPSMQQSKGATTVWQYEGLCEYFSYVIHPAYSLKRSYTYDVLHLYGETGNAAGEGKSPNADNRAFWARVTESYLDNASLPETPEALHLPLFIRCMAEAASRYPQELMNSIWVTPIDPLRPGIPGNELTYAQVFCLISYLIDRYSLGTYLDYCAGYSNFEASFSMSYDDVKKLYMETIPMND